MKKQKQQNELLISKKSAVVGKKTNDCIDYIDSILHHSENNLKKHFSSSQLEQMKNKIESIRGDGFSVDEKVDGFCEIYMNFCKEIRQKKYKYNDIKFSQKIKNASSDNVNVIWGNCLNAMKKMDSESLQLLITSPPYYNAREYSQWDNLDLYLKDMDAIVAESYRVLDNHRAFVFNIGDITGNDNRNTRSSWGARRIPLGAYFINIFEKNGFTFIDDFIWDKGQVQSQRHKNGDTPYPMYQYPMNAYEHIMIFIKHEKDPLPYPCPVCGCLKVNGNSSSGVGIKSWECKNNECFRRSPNNRGKRFSARSVMMESLKNPENKIEKDFLTKWRRDIVSLPPVIKINSSGENTLGHTAPFPFQIPEFAIKTLSGVGERVFDPFAGSFTTAIQACKLKRVGIGAEMNRDEFEKSILMNIEKHCGHKKVNIIK